MDKLIVCPDCRGRGTRALHGIALTQDDLADWSEDEIDAYVAGDYDTVCETCNGRNVVDTDELEFQREMERETRIESLMLYGSY